MSDYSKPYDIQGARKEGYSDKDLAPHLMERFKKLKGREFDYQGAVEDQYTPAQINDYLASVVDKPSVVKQLWKEVAATPRVIGSTVAGMATWPVGKILGVGTLMEGGTKEGAEAAEERVAKLIPKWLQPKKGASEAATNLLSKGLDIALTPARMAGESMTNLVGPRAGYLTELGAELFMFKFGGDVKLTAKGKLQKVKAAKILRKKYNVLNPKEKFFVDELVKKHTIKQIRAKEEEKITNKEYSDLITEEFNKELLNKEPEKTKVPVAPSLPKPPQKEKFIVGGGKSVNEPTKIKFVKKETKKLQKEEQKKVKFNQKDLTQPAIRMSDGTVYEGTEFSDSWSVSKPDVAIKEGPKALSVAREKARSDGKKIQDKNGNVFYEQGFIVNKQFVSTDTIAKKFNVVEKVAKKKAARIAKQGMKELAIIEKEKKTAVLHKEKVKKIRETTQQDEIVFNDLVPTDITKEGNFVETTHNNIAKKVVNSFKNKYPALAETFTHDELNNVARKTIWEYVKKVNPADIDAYVNGGITSKIKGTAYKAAEFSIQNYVKKQLGSKVGKSRRTIAQELKDRVFKDTIAYEEGKRSSIAEGREAAIEEAHFEGREAPRAGKSVKDKYLGKVKTDAEMEAKVKATAGPVKKLSVKEYLKQKKKEEELAKKIETLSLEKAQEKFKGKIKGTKKSKFIKLNKEERLAEIEKLDSERKAALQPPQSHDKPFAIQKLKEQSGEAPILNDIIKLPKTLGNGWKKNIGEPVWDKLVLKTIPRIIDKIPYVGRRINRAALYDYRGNMKKTGKFIKDMDSMRRKHAIGKEYALDLGGRLQSLNEASQLKVAESIKGGKPKLNKVESALAKESMQVLYDLGKQSVDVGLLSGKEFFENAGKYMPRLYTEIEYMSKLKEYGLSAPDKLDLSRFKSRKNLPEKVRKELGEILTPGYPVAKGIITLTHDIEIAKFFKTISETKEWAIPKKSKKNAPKDWKRLPLNKKLGALSQAKVHPEIHKDIVSTIKVRGEWEMRARKALGMWKYGKVVLSPKTHARNVMSNSILAHLGGLPMYEQPVYLSKAWAAMKNKSNHYRNARKEGLLSHTFISAELKDLFSEIDGKLKKTKLTELPGKYGEIGEMINKVISQKDKPALLYELEEQWFKVAKYIHNVERKKMSPKDAAIDAEKWLFNYSKVTKFQEAYRGGHWVGLLVGAPFATFTLKAIPRIAEAAIKTPWRFALPYAIIYSLEESAREMIGDTKEQAKAKKEQRSEWMKGVNFMGVETFPRVPYIDNDGREHYLNLQYILPWGDIAETGGVNIIPGGVRPLSMPFMSEAIQQLSNYDTFWKQKIVPDEELAGKTGAQKTATQLKIRGAHIAKTLAPTLAVDTVKVIREIAGKPDYRGRTRSGALTAADVLLGIKIYPVVYAEQITKKISKLHPKKGSIARKIKSQIVTLNVKRNAMLKQGKNTKRYDDKIDNKIQQLRGMANKLIKESKSYNKTLK